MKHTTPSCIKLAKEGKEDLSKAVREKASRGQVLNLEYRVILDHGHLSRLYFTGPTNPYAAGKAK